MRRHRINRPQIVHVIEHCGLVFLERPAAGAPAGATKRRVFLGDDPEGVALEVMAVLLEEGILVIHAMPLQSGTENSTRRRRNGARETKRAAADQAR